MFKQRTQEYFVAWISYYRNLSELKSLTLGRCDSLFEYIISYYLLIGDTINNSGESALRWVPMILITYCSHDAMRLHRPGSTLAQIMAWCLRASSHYLNQCWQIISQVLWYSSEYNFPHEMLKISINNISFKITNWRLQPHHREDNELKIGQHYN